MITFASLRVVSVHEFVGFNSPHDTVYFGDGLSRQIHSTGTVSLIFTAMEQKV